MTKHTKLNTNIPAFGQLHRNRMYVQNYKSTLIRLCICTIVYPKLFKQYGNAFPKNTQKTRLQLVKGYSYVKRKRTKSRRIEMAYNLCLTSSEEPISPSLSLKDVSTPCHTDRWWTRQVLDSSVYCHQHQRFALILIRLHYQIIVQLTLIISISLVT